ncbi:MAG TPA: energy transducer TonB [Aquabacterium sp.]|uniref:energy transducer TonB n=1 Tax=Aquabacterium sp. TaxID=1872578 RepID=UPI002E32B200|nr:energy transducer TonB [Aquabacterium sp.]HEX5373585.1 energy transducer TonB [Aquabacterium sp.]
MLQRLRTAVSQMTLLHKTLLVSVAVHAGLLTVRFVDPEGFNRFFQDTPLEVILVNAASQERPDKAQALAQANLAGGGDVDKGRATSPLPPSPHSELGDSLEETRRMIEEMQAEQQQLLSMVQNELAALPPPQPRRMAERTESRADRERRKQLTELLAEIEKRIREENAKPKKRYLSPATLKSADALYYSHFRAQVERSGTENFPTAQGRKLYGDLVMEVWLNRQGEVVDTIITRSSGNKQLDKRAASIVRKAGPFGVVPDEVRAGHDLLLISSRFKFTRDAGMEASTHAMPPTP